MNHVPVSEYPSCTAILSQSQVFEVEGKNKWEVKQHLHEIGCGLSTLINLIRVRTNEQDLVRVAKKFHEGTNIAIRARCI